MRHFNRRTLLEYDAGTARLKLHDLVRVFAAARLEDAEAVRLRHAKHYTGVAVGAGELYLRGGEHVSLALALFDQERPHIDAGWRWAHERARSLVGDRLLLAYSNATVFIGDLRYDKRRARIPQLEAGLAAARRLGDRRSEATALGSLGNAYADLGDARKAITFYTVSNSGLALCQVAQAIIQSQNTSCMRVSAY